MEVLTLGRWKMFSLRIVFVLYFMFSVAASTSEMYLEPGVFKFETSFSPSAGGAEGYEFRIMQKSMYANSEIGIEVLNCSSDPKDCKFTLEWTVRQSDCDGVYRYLFQDGNTTAPSMENIYNEPNCFILLEEHTISYVKSVEVKPNPDIVCSEDTQTHDKLNDLKGSHWDCSSRAEIPVCNKKPVCGPRPEEKKTTKPDDKNKDGSSGDEPDDKNKDGSSGDKPDDKNKDGSSGDKPDDKNKDGSSGDKPDVKDGQRKRRAPVENPDPPNKQDTPAAPQPTSPQPTSPQPTSPAKNNTLLKSRVVHTNEKDGRFLFVLFLTSKSAKQMNVSLRVRMKSPHGYLSATQYPLLPFYGIMCAMYSVLGLVWMVLLFRQWRDLLRIQFWISVVIILGLIEKAAFVAEYERHNNSGTNTSAGIFFAEELSVLKRTMARMLVIVVSLGYGITRPRLGRDLNWLMGAGVLFFLLSTIETYFRIYEVNKNNGLIALLPLSVLDSVLCWWIFRSLVDTSRTLRLRRNLVKLWLYRHFTNALIFCVVAAVVFLVWSLRAHKMNKCVRNWNEIWVDDAYWHILFCVILIVIMILFRPTANNQRYAYSVLSDAVDEDESKEPMMNDAFESVKLRNVHSNKSSSHTKEVDDLQWVEDNIPAAVADAALGAFDDSEEELITNVERNKME